MDRGAGSKVVLVVAVVVAASDLPGKKYVVVAAWRFTDFSGGHGNGCYGDS